MTELRGPAGEPDEEVELTAGEVAATLSSGTRVEGWGFNGSLPGPALEFDEGDLVEVTLRNELPEDPVTIHWHGIDVPNGEDGVAGVTQDAVAPGEEFTYRFRAEESGSHWYHSHQNGSEQAARGLFGPLCCRPTRTRRSTTTCPCCGTSGTPADDRSERSASTTPSRPAPSPRTTPSGCGWSTRPTRRRRSPSPAPTTSSVTSTANPSRAPRRFETSAWCWEPEADST